MAEGSPKLGRPSLRPQNKNITGFDHRTFFFSCKILKLFIIETLDPGPDRVDPKCWIQIHNTATEQNPNPDLDQAQV